MVQTYIKKRIFLPVNEAEYAISLFFLENRYFVCVLFIVCAIFAIVLIKIMIAV